MMSPSCTSKEELSAASGLEKADGHGKFSHKCNRNMRHLSCCQSFQIGIRGGQSACLIPTHCLESSLASVSLRDVLLRAGTITNLMLCFEDLFIIKKVA